MDKLFEVYIELVCVDVVLDHFDGLKQITLEITQILSAVASSKYHTLCLR